MSVTSFTRSGMDSCLKPLVTVTTRTCADGEGGGGAGEARARARVASPTAERVGMSGTIAMVAVHRQRGVIDCRVVMTLLRVPPPVSKAVDLKRTYDAVIVRSGAAGGMAAHVLTSHGLDVLLLAAGKKLEIEKEHVESDRKSTRL